MSSQLEDKRVFIFLETMPQRQGSGASLRFYSNVRAYLDLGFAVEVIQVAESDDHSVPSNDLRPVVWSRLVEPAPSASAFARLMFRCGIPHEAAVRYYYGKHSIVRRKVEEQLQQFPNAIYQFDGESLANVVPWLPRSTRAIWSLHDLPSTVVLATSRIAQEREKRGATRAERRELRFAKRLEKFMARRSRLILCIGIHDRDRLRNKWNCGNAEYLPMSIPDDGISRQNGWLKNGGLRLLHLGRVSHLPSYRSLEFLLSEVFTRLSPKTLERISMDVVGQLDENDARAKRILELAAPFTNVHFRGFVDDVAHYYRCCDLQVVGSTDASGLRTRTIESLAHGLPVLSTNKGAEGIPNLQAGREILLTDDPQEFANQLSVAAHDPAVLEQLSEKGRAFYLEHHSQAAVAKSLGGHLEKYFGSGMTGF